MNSPDIHTEADWKTLLAESVCTPEKLPAHLVSDRSGLNEVVRTYPMRVNRYYLSLIRHPGDPMARQAVPDAAELSDTVQDADPLAEAKQSPVPNVIHRYPDRVVFLVSNQCALLCHHCMRKRRVGLSAVTDADLTRGIDYIKHQANVRDVVLSGGDPLLLDDDRLEDLLARLHHIPHVDIIRIHTRVLCALPQRITPALTEILKKFPPIYVNTQFNHPDEITTPARTACNMLADTGMVLGCQTVLLRSVNDTPDIIRSLMRRLLTLRVRPYYLHHPDPVRGTGHFHVSIDTGLTIMAALRGHMSGLCVPQYMIDLPGGGGKIPLLPEYVVKKEVHRWLIKNHEGRIFEYRQHH